MEHNHQHHHGKGNIKIAFFLNLGFTVIEIIGGLYTNSLAVLSDALHDLGDSLSLGLSWYFQKLSEKGRSKAFSYGYKRFSLLGAIINSIVLMVGSVIILSQAIPGIINPSDANAQGMLYLAVLGIIVNGIAVLKLKKGTSINEKVVSLHLMEDVLGWVAVLIGSIVMMNFDAPFIDPLLSILISSFVLFNVFKSLRKSFQVILQGTPDEVDIEKVRKKLLEIEQVENLHDCHVWSMDGEYHVMSIHLTLKENIDWNEQAQIKSEVRNLLKNESIDHLTIELEHANEDCEM